MRRIYLLSAALIAAVALTGCGAWVATTGTGISSGYDYSDGIYWPGGIWYNPAPAPPIVGNGPGSIIPTGPAVPPPPPGGPGIAGNAPTPLPGVPPVNSPAQPSQPSIGTPAFTTRPGSGFVAEPSAALPASTTLNIPAGRH